MTSREEDMEEQLDVAATRVTELQQMFRAAIRVALVPGVERMESYSLLAQRMTEVEREDKAREFCAHYAAVKYKGPYVKPVRLGLWCSDEVVECLSVELMVRRPRIRAFLKSEYDIRYDRWMLMMSRRQRRETDGEETSSEEERDGVVISDRRRN